MSLIRSIATQMALTTIRLYQWCISPMLGTHCRFEPSCSHYAQHAVIHHGPVRGSWLALKRLLRCHPFAKHGYDPVPPVYPKS